MTAPSATSPVQRAQPCDWLAVLLLLGFAFLQLYYCDLTFHGPDQIRDVDTARQWLHGGQWPRSSTPFNGRFFLPPGFYYLLGLPLLVVDSEVSIFAAFGLFNVACLGWAWAMLRTHLGSRVALAYVALCMPIFGSVYTHSAWNPALVMGLSSLVLALWVRALHRPDTGWFALVLAMFVLLQVHPSAALLALVMGLFAVVHPAVLRQSGTWAGIGVVLALTAWWALWAKPWSIERVVAAPPPPSEAGWAALAGRLLSPGKWWDALAMPYHMVAGIEPALPMVAVAAAALLGVLLVGVLLGLVRAARSPAMRWVAAAVLVWWSMAMLLLPFGAFWYLDVIQPWMALLAAYGWAGAGADARWARSAAAWLVAMAAVGVVALGGQWALYRQFEVLGKLDLGANASFFPRIPGPQRWAPSFSFRYLRAMQDYVDSESLCQSQLRGLYWMLVRDMTNRQFDARCQAAAGGALATQYLIEPQAQAVPSAFTQGLAPVAALPGAAVYAFAPLPLRVNGREGGNVFTDERLDYMTFAPATHREGIALQISAPGPAVLRVALRCTDETVLPPPEGWSVVQGSSSVPPRAEHFRYMGSNYYTLEWSLLPTLPGASITVATPSVALQCDVSAAARALH